MQGTRALSRRRAPRRAARRQGWPRVADGLAVEHADRPRAAHRVDREERARGAQRGEADVALGAAAARSQQHLARDARDAAARERRRQQALLRVDPARRCCATPRPGSRRGRRAAPRPRRRRARRRPRARAAGGSSACGRPRPADPRGPAARGSRSRRTGRAPSPRGTPTRRSRPRRGSRESWSRTTPSPPGSAARGQLAQRAARRVGVEASERQRAARRARAGAGGAPRSAASPAAIRTLV